MQFKEDEITLEPEMRKGQMVVPVLRPTGQVRYVNYAKYLAWEKSWVAGLAQDRVFLDALACVVKTRVMIGKAPRYFDSRAQAITALNSYNAKRGITACSVR